MCWGWEACCTGPLLCTGEVTLPPCYRGVAFRGSQRAVTHWRHRTHSQQSWDLNPGLRVSKGAGRHKAAKGVEVWWGQEA